MTTQPTGKVTLLFTDVEGSTGLLRRLGRQSYADALALHRRVLRDAFERHGAYEVACEGDSFLWRSAKPGQRWPRRPTRRRRQVRRIGRTTSPSGFGSASIP